MAELISSGVELMGIGMGIVFLFLTMLVVAINIMSTLIQRFFPDQPLTNISVPLATSGATDKKTAAAISAAVHQYRNKHK
jgi:oxaloacetate decarboxylase (Na+ extruding) subunit gamma